MLFKEVQPAKASKEDITADRKQDQKVKMELECMDQEETIENQIDKSAGRRLRRLKRTPNPPDYFGVRVHMADGEPAERRIVSEAGASPQKKKWEKAMEFEMESLRQNNVLKSDADGITNQCKARLVTQGFT